MRYLMLLLPITLVLLFYSTNVSARPEYVGSTGQTCTSCHISQEGGALNEKGLDFAASGYKWPPTKRGYRILTPIKKSVRLFVGYLHILAAFMWFGTILYVHILLRPGYASKGLPKGEVILGLSSMTIVGVTGILLTISRINHVSVLYETRWGMLLSLKIVLYAVMITSAVTVVTVVGPKLKRTRKNLSPPEDGIFNPVTLAMFDGNAGHPAFVAHKGTVYDVSGSRLWKGGNHMRLHTAGSDLTGAISRAPHGAEKIEAQKIVGTYDATKKAAKTSVQKAFYFIAYMNLTLVFSVLLVIAFWRWGG
jgi:predicted heme/steroid binding protein/uncharacterized membrane protein